jgi:hypothetical protein
VTIVDKYVEKAAFILLKTMWRTQLFLYTVDSVENYIIQDLIYLQVINVIFVENIKADIAYPLFHSSYYYDGYLF